MNFEDNPFELYKLEKLMENLQGRTAPSLQYVNGYRFNIYGGGLFTDKEYLISLQVSNMMGRDCSNITIFDANDKYLVAECSISPITANTLNLSKFIYRLVTDYIPNSKVLIIRNNMGLAIIEKLIGTRIKDKIALSDGIKQSKLFEGVDLEHPLLYYGIMNNGVTYNQSVELLKTIIEKDVDVNLIAGDLPTIISPDILEDILALKTYKNGKNIELTNRLRSYLFGLLYLQIQETNTLKKEGDDE